jgi:hypothetical protein
MDPLLGLALVGMFGVAALMQRSNARGGSRPRIELV